MKGEKSNSSSAVLWCLDVDLADISAVCASSDSQLLLSGMPTPIRRVFLMPQPERQLVWTLFLARRRCKDRLGCKLLILFWIRESKLSTACKSLALIEFGSWRGRGHMIKDLMFAWFADLSDSNPVSYIWAIVIPLLILLTDLPLDPQQLLFPVSARSNTSHDPPSLWRSPGAKFPSAGPSVSSAECVSTHASTNPPQ